MSPKDHFWNMPPHHGLALTLARRHLAEFVCDAVNLEGIPLTLPEVQTLLDGVTVGGHKLSDQRIALSQGDAWRALFEWIEAGEFDVSAKTARSLHSIAGKEEALEWGHFRSGAVTIAGTRFIPPKAGSLPRLFEEMIHDFNEIKDIYDGAIHLFLTMARSQFFYDVNKRMGRFMMNGALLSHGYPAINVPAKRQLEFNQLMLGFYDSNDPSPMNRFLRSCLDPRAVQIMKEGASAPSRPE
ncbi:Fic/DOC family protein [Candidatus Desulfarcum epimagneticum]|uniref:Fic/DOC family protein n=1 Tax=uncultured Desulfobacteraceae bacterium TaxID=218296 RepID=A0A484HHL8_9BACT|nr:Fic/DOC family protein [uncultured Desulfobacteraceae bacterium]